MRATALLRRRYKKPSLLPDGRAESQIWILLHLLNISLEHYVAFSLNHLALFGKAAMFFKWQLHG
jgi:hypothetical protein